VSEPVPRPEGRRRGRPQRLPEDPLPLSSRAITPEARVAWLLATTRLLHRDHRVGQREAFRAALAETGVHVDGSRISRWESGAAPAPEAAITGYETVAGLRPGRLLTAVESLRRAFGEPARQPEPGDVGPPDELLELALAGDATGDQWRQLGGRLAGFDRIFLRAADWELLSGRLISELSRSVGPAYVRRYEAAALLIRHPDGQRPVSRSLGRFVMHPHTQVVLPVLNLLTEVDDAGASALTLRMMGEDNRGLRRAAAAVAAVKLRRGLLPDDALPRLERYAASSMRRSEPLDGAQDAFDVAMQLPSRSFLNVLDQIPDRRVQAQLGRSRSTGELLTRQQAAAVVADVAAAVQGDESEVSRHPEPDMMLRRLLREALFHTHKSLRHHAGVLLAASAYAPAVARQCHHLLGGSNYFLAARAWALMMRVGHAADRPGLVLRALSEPRPTLRARAMVNLGLSPIPVTNSEAKALIGSMPADTRGSVRHGLLFALGMGGSPLLDEVAKKHQPEAEWWRTQGSAIFV
jgi:hypothetical protein